MKKSPDTGDGFNAVLFIAAAVVSLGDYAGVMVYKKKHDFADYPNN